MERTPSPTQAGARIRTLPKPSNATTRFGTRARNSRTLPTSLLDSDWRDQSETEDESDGTTSAEEMISSRERALVAKVRRRAKLFEESKARPAMGGLTVLERAPISGKSEAVYTQAMARFLELADSKCGKLVEDEEVDAGMVAFLNHRFSIGMPAHDGDVTMAGLMHFQPRFGKGGKGSIPRSWRALKGWRRRAPSRSRTAFPFLVWAGVTWDLCLRGYWSMGFIFCGASVRTAGRQSRLVSAAGT